jgi:predicted DNA-binding transcriptional regulator AlpA
MRWLVVQAVCARYSISDRTVDRWVEAGVLPKPVYIQGRRYWSEESLNERDEARLVVAQPTDREMLDGAA